MSTSDNSPSLDFVRSRVAEDRREGKNGGRVHTRFPPEPNGYLHLGHAKSICLNFGLAQDFQGLCNLRFDDTNPETEDPEFVESIQADVRWLGFDWDGRLFYASDYFEKIFGFAVELIQKGLAYVCDLSPDAISAGRGTLTTAGTDSPFRSRSVAENLDLFERMRAGEFADGVRVLRAKIDMAHQNLLLRDPVIYRIKKVAHYRTGTKWCIYPTYDFAHGYCDALEGITHSICTLEFENHRPLYDWLIRNVSSPCHPQQIEFARLNLTYTLMSKRKLLVLVQQKIVSGWDDPRMPTLAGVRRRGVPPEALRKFCETIGVAKYNSTVDVALLEHHIREELNRRAPRYLAVLDPVKVVIENWPKGQVDHLEAVNNPEDPSKGTRLVPFSGELWIERDDFREDPPKKYFRLAPGVEVRLRYAYFIRCQSVVKDPKTGEIVEIRCTYDPATRGGNAPDGRKVKGTIHWVSAAHALKSPVRLYEHLFVKEDPEDVPAGADFRANLNPRSLETRESCFLEPALRDIPPGTVVQFERLGYFCVDAQDSKPGAQVWNRTITLKDTWSKVEQKSQD